MHVLDAMGRLPVIASMPEEARRALAVWGRLRILRRRARVFSEGQPSREFAFVVDGRVKLLKSQQTGRDVIIDLIGVGHLLCGNAVYAGAPYCCSGVVAGGDALILLLPRAESIAVLDRSPESTRMFLGEITCRGMTLCQRVSEVAGGRVEQRIATLFLRLADQVGVDRPAEGRWIPVALSRKDLADLCGTTIETAIRVMGRLERKHVLITGQSGFMLRSRESLSAISRGSSTSLPVVNE